MDLEFNLYELSDKELDNILALSDEELATYIHTLIHRFYAYVIESGEHETYESLLQGYKSSFIFEKFYRDTIEFQNGFQAIYTKTGLVRDVINELYFNDDHLITH